MSSFSDITFVERSPCHNFIEGLKAMLCETVRSEIITWENTNNYCQFDGKKLTCLRDNCGYPIFSQQLSHGKIIYYQIRINELELKKYIYSCLTVGFSDKIKHIWSHYTFFEVCKGDILGIVLDRVENCVKYYQNGKFMSKGLEEAQSLRKVYAIIELYLQKCEIETGDFIRFNDLL
jgi:hypothetical protein